ncbi:amidase family protein [Neisseria sp.]|uniref:amidase family protein n=1 Tax=Neisseria sp. TaxID=192066 RepID=UPI0026DD4562|nr:amidase family protein [Neisseria sp.]MDO4906266.1 amidase family protein [Neisseria sp.]
MKYPAPQTLPTVAALNAAFECGTATPSALAESLLQRAAQTQSVFTALTPERALAAALAAETRLKTGRRLGALDGIPVSWKDLFDQTGETTRAGSPTTAHDAPKTHNAAAVDLLESMGAVSLGRTNLTEFAFSGLGLNPHYGTPPNVWPYPEPSAPGGSSCGAAVSVACGLAAYAMGTDTSGSIRIPAALNGLVGFKPTSARLSRIGVWTLSPTLDSIGPLAHTVADVCTVMAAFGIRAGTVSDGLRIVVPQGLYGEDAEPQILQAFENNIGRLKAAGAEITRKPLRALERLEALFGGYGTLVGIEAWQLHQGALAQAALMDERVAKRLQANAAWPPQNLAQLLARRTHLQHMLAEELQGALLLMPTTAVGAPPLARLEQDQNYFFACNAKILRNTMAGSFLDMPSLTIPAGLNADGLPAAMMVSAPYGCDETVLAAGKALAQLLTGDEVLNAVRLQGG